MKTRTSFEKLVEVFGVEAVGEAADWTYESEGNNWVHKSSKREWNRDPRSSKNCVVFDDVKIENRVQLGSNLIIKPGVIIEEHCAVENRVVLEQRALLQDNCNIGSGAIVVGVVEAGAQVPENLVMGMTFFPANMQVEEFDYMYGHRTHETTATYSPLRLPEHPAAAQREALYKPRPRPAHVVRGAMEYFTQAVVYPRQKTGPRFA